MIEKFLNKRYSLRVLTDQEFEDVLPILSEELEKEDFKPNYNNDLLIKNWDALKHFNTCNNYISAQERAGMKILEHFMKNVWDVQNYKGKSFSNSWTKENIMKSLRFNRKAHSTPYLSEIRRGIYFVSGLVKTTMYRPTVTKLIVDKYKVQTLLDPCCGWGGRMIGTSCDFFKKYIGFEPNVETYNNLIEMKKFLELDNAELYCEPAETGLNKINEKVDAILTSPPYFNLEIYSKESTQSISYKTYDEWIKNFLQPVIEKGISLLTNEGISCWNVANFITDKKYNLIDDVLAIHENLGFSKIEEISVLSSKKPTGNKLGKEKNKDTTMIFRKQYGKI